MEMVESKEPDSICQIGLKVTDDSHFNLADENSYEGSPTINEKSDLICPPVVVNGDSRLDDDAPPDSHNAVSCDAPPDSHDAVSCDAQPELRDELSRDSPSVIVTNGEESGVTDKSACEKKTDDGCGEKTDEVCESEDKVDQTDGTVECGDGKTDKSLSELANDTEEGTLLQGDVDDSVAMTDAEEDILLCLSSQEESEKDPPVAAMQEPTKEVEEKEQGESEEENSPIALSPSQEPATNVQNAPDGGDDDDKMDEDDDASLSVEVVPEEKAEIIVREEVDIPLDSPKTDDGSVGEGVKEKCDDVMQVDEQGLNGDDTDLLKADEDSKEVEVAEKTSLEDTHNATDDSDRKSESSEITEIKSKDDVVNESENENTDVRDDKIDAADVSELQNDDDCEILLVGENEASVSGDEHATPSSSSELKRRRPSGSEGELDDDEDNPAKKLKKTVEESHLEATILEADEAIEELKQKNPAKVYVATTERKRQIYSILEAIYRKPDLAEVVEKFETMMLKAFGEVLVSETSNGKARVAYQKCKDELDLLGKTVTGYRKQKEDLKLVVQKVIDIAKHSKPSEALVPPKVTRSVGLQVCTVGSMYIKSRDIKKSPAKVTAVPVAPKLTPPLTLPQPTSSTLKTHVLSNGPTSGVASAATLVAASKQSGGSFVIRQSSQAVNNKNTVVVTNGRQRPMNGGASSIVTPPLVAPQRRILPAPPTPSPKPNTNPSALSSRSSPQANNSSSTRPANSNIVKKSTSSVPTATVTVTSSTKKTPGSAEVIDLTDKDDEAAARPRPVARKRTSGVNNNNPSLATKKAEPANNVCSVPLPKSPLYPASVVRPPTPLLRLCESQSDGVMLSWQFDSGDDVSKITKYQLYAIQAKKPPAQNGSTESVQQDEREWRKIGDVNALPLPMACTLTQFKKGSRYCFSVRAVDKDNHVGEFSNVCNSLIK